MLLELEAHHPVCDQGPTINRLITQEKLCLQLEFPLHDFLLDFDIEAELDTAVPRAAL